MKKVSTQVVSWVVHLYKTLSTNATSANTIFGTFTQESHNLSLNLLKKVIKTNEKVYFTKTYNSQLGQGDGKYVYLIIQQICDSPFSTLENLPYIPTYYLHNYTLPYLTTHKLPILYLAAHYLPTYLHNSTYILTLPTYRLTRTYLYTYTNLPTYLHKPTYILTLPTYRLTPPTYRLTPT